MDRICFPLCRRVGLAVILVLGFAAKGFAQSSPAKSDRPESAEASQRCVSQLGLSVAAADCVLATQPAEQLERCEAEGWDGEHCFGRYPILANFIRMRGDLAQFRSPLVRRSLASR